MVKQTAGRDALREKTEWVLHSIACRAAIMARSMGIPAVFQLGKGVARCCGGLPRSGGC